MIEFLNRKIYKYNVIQFSNRKMYFINRKMKTHKRVGDLLLTQYYIDPIDFKSQLKKHRVKIHLNLNDGMIYITSTINLHELHPN